MLPLASSCAYTHPTERLYTSGVGGEVPDRNPSNIAEKRRQMENSGKHQQLDLETLHQFSLDLARRAGDLIVGMREEARRSAPRFKSAAQFVTAADEQAEQLIIKAVKKRYPDHAVLGEESAPDASEALMRGPIWIVDPIDGTTNYFRGHPHCAVSIGFADAGRLQSGVVHAPFSGETFEARRGRGALRNGSPITINKETPLQQSLIATGFPGESDRYDLKLRRVRSILDSCHDLRRLGAASLDICWVAAGFIDGFFERLKPWDMAAAVLIAREAGALSGQITEQEADRLRPEELRCEDLLVAPPHLFDLLLAALRAA